MEEAEGNKVQQAARFVVMQVLEDVGGGVTMIPVRAFDTEAEAIEFHDERGKSIAKLPPQAQQICSFLGIKGLGLAIRGVPTPGPKRTIVLAGPGALADLSRRPG